MASPQLENGYTRISNELLEALCRARLTGGEWDIVMSVVRASYGWSQKLAPISVREVAKRLEKHYSHTKETVRELIAKGLLDRQPGGIGIVKDYETWGGRQSVPGTVDGPGDGRGAHGGTVERPTGGTKSVPPLPLNPTSPKVPRVRKESTKESTKESSSKFASLTLSQYLFKHTPEGQEVLRQTVEAIATTRKSGKVAQSVLDAFTGKANRYPVQAVLSACRIYLAKNYAGEGKREPYLLGIIRGEAERMKSNGRKPSGPVVNQDRAPTAPHATAPKTPGQLLIDRTLASMRAEQEHTR